MVFFSIILDIVGLGFGILFGLLIGYFFFIYGEPRDVKDPVAPSINELDDDALLLLLPEIPKWVKSPDYKRVDWINKFIASMFPYLNKAICNEIQGKAKAIFDEYVGKFRVQSIRFGQITLGSMPPIINGIKVFKTREKELIMESSIHFAGNPNISIEFKFWNMIAVVQLSELQISLVPQVKLKPLVPVFPCFGGIDISLTEKPVIDFGLKIFNGDIMAIPGIYQITQTKILNHVSNLFLWPKSQLVRVLDGFCDAEVVDKPMGILHVNVVRALNLQKMDILGKSDPYVCLNLSNENKQFKSRKTTVKMKTLNPEWNEYFQMSVKDPQSQVLNLHAYDWEKVKQHDKLGMQVIPLSLLVPNETKTFTLDLLKNLNPNDPQNKKNRGKIVVELTYNPFTEDSNTSICGLLDRSDINESIRRSSTTNNLTNGGVLLVTIERAEHIELKRCKKIYATILFKGEYNKTKRVKYDSSPKWNEQFEYTLEEAPVDQKIRIGVMSKRKSLLVFPKNESLGHVEINLSDVVSNRRINEKYHLIDSKRGIIQLEMTWRTIV